MKKLACLVVLLIGTACGGGGGGGGAIGNTAPNPPPPTPPTESEIIQQLLDGCGLESTSEFQGLYDLIVGLLGPTGAAPALSITGVNILDVSFGWGVDLDTPPDGVNDLTGTTALRDAANNPTLGGLSAADLLGLVSGGTAALPGLLANLDPGTRIVTTFNGAPPSNAANLTISGTLSVVMGAAGAFDTSSGAITTTAGPDCTSTLTWTDIDISGVTTPGTIPSGTFTLGVATATDTLDGTVTLDGTNTAAVVVSRNGGPQQSYSLDLATGALTPA